MNPEMCRLKRKQLDDRVRPFMATHVSAPRLGWIRTVRTALGMSLEQLARRLKITLQAVSKIERSEANGSISLRQLKRVADAMQCEVLVVLVPREGSYEATVMRQAERKAHSLDRGVLHTMALERQSAGIDSATGRSQHVEWWATKNLRRLWD